MTEALWTAVDQYITDMLVPPDPVLDAALEASEAAGLPAIQVTPNQGKLLHLLGPPPRRAENSGDWHARRLQHHLARAGAARRWPPDHARVRPEGTRTSRGKIFRAGAWMPWWICGLAARWRRCRKSPRRAAAHSISPLSTPTSKASPSISGLPVNYPGGAVSSSPIMLCATAG